MCANYEPPAPKNFQAHLGSEEPRFNYTNGAYPGSRAVFITAGEENESVFSRWPGIFGPPPPWVPDRKSARFTDNARSETVDSRPSFKAAWKARRRCLIPAQARFEPKYESGRAERWRIARADGLPFCMAGIWEEGHHDSITVWSYSMLTINADTHPLMRYFHKPGEEKRCVVMAPPAHYRDLLCADARGARMLLRPWPADGFTAAPAPWSLQTVAKVQTVLACDSL
ncbi:SOS response-associated peptidase [Azohydromonas caseinilytica]|uniref:Abasic site processing protein n=1 Tax=Azohydromonas caseinilytica TaxID=2728836 RepID=A0A848FFV3_9BURK|nr:SOS response-associated peptidase family protein [Azohydromonas caseinilytica]NML18318.1 SOS response-associated peptidase [Azohydromonas caseinilytica]